MAYTDKNKQTTLNHYKLMGNLPLLSLPIELKKLEKFMKENPRRRYLANVNPNNIKSQKFFQNNNFKLIQHTYELEK